MLLYIITSTHPGFFEISDPRLKMGTSPLLNVSDPMTREQLEEFKKRNGTWLFPWPAFPHWQYTETEQVHYKLIEINTATMTSREIDHYELDPCDEDAEVYRTRATV
jgi:hypothetical protein